MMIVLFIAVIALALVVWYNLTENRFTVSPKQSERIIVVNNEREMLVLQSGTHSLGPDWVKFQVLDTNRDPQNVIGETFKTKNGVRMKMNFRYDTILGRPFNEKNGTLIHPYEKPLRALKPTEYDDQTLIDEELLKDLVTRMNVEKGDDKTIAKDFVTKAVEATMSVFTDEELVRPADAIAKAIENNDDSFKIPRLLKQGKIGLDDETWMIHEGFISEKTPLHDDEFWGQIALLIELRTNFLLRDFGINVIGVKITEPPSYVDTTAQKDLESKARRDKLKDVKKTSSLSVPQVLAANTDQFAGVCQAEAWKSLADAIPAMGTAIGTAIGSALANKNNSPPQPPTSPT